MGSCYYLWFNFCFKQLLQQRYLILEKGGSCIETFLTGLKLKRHSWFNHSRSVLCQLRNKSKNYTIFHTVERLRGWLDSNFREFCFCIDAYSQKSLIGRISLLSECGRNNLFKSSITNTITFQKSNSKFFRHMRISALSTLRNPAYKSNTSCCESEHSSTPWSLSTKSTIFSCWYC